MRCVLAVVAVLVGCSSSGGDLFANGGSGGSALAELGATGGEGSVTASGGAQAGSAGAGGAGVSTGGGRSTGGATVASGGGMAAGSGGAAPIAAGSSGGDAATGGASTDPDAGSTSPDAGPVATPDAGPTKVTIYLMLDQGGTMKESGASSSGASKWGIAATGVSTFANSVASAGIDLAIGFFPPTFGQYGNCDGSGYDLPTVPASRLPTDAAAVTSALPGTATGLGKPIEGALRGAESYCEGLQAHGEKCVVVFATDGKPSSCDTNLVDLAQIVADGHVKGVQTFAMGFASVVSGEVDFDFLNSLAKAGGTTCSPGESGIACFVASIPDMTAALEIIRKAATPP